MLMWLTRWTSATGPNAFALEHSNGETINLRFVPRVLLGLMTLLAVGLWVPADLYATGWQEEATEQQEDADTGAEAEASDQDSDKEDGTADFERATELKVSARTVRDLDKVVALCESAIEKGLDESSEKFCRQMMIDALYEYGQQYSKLILTPQRDRRWQFLRREALIRLEKAVQLQDDHRDAWMLIAKLNVLENGNRDRGLEAINKVIELSGDNKSELAEALMVRAGFAEGDEDRLEDLNQAVEVDPDNVEARRSRGLYFYLKDDYEKAIEDFRAIYDKDKDDLASLLLLSETLMKMEKADEALELLEESGKSDDVRVAMMKAQLFFTNEDYEKSLENAQKVLEANKENLQAINLQILSLISLDRYEDALTEANKLVRMAPGFPQAYWLRSIALSSLERFDEAISDLQLLVENVPGQPLYRLQLANVYNASDRPRRAIKIYDDLFAEDTELDGLYRSRGDAYLSIGKHAEAIEDYEKELENDPEDSGTLNNLAWVLATTPKDELRDGKRALELAIKSCELTDYSKPHILSTLASAHAEVGDFDKAMEWIDKALKLAEEEDSPNLEDIKKEKAAYEKKEPWRELEQTEEAPLKDDDGEKPEPEKKKEASDEDDF